MQAGLAGSTVARNYADTLLSLARSANDTAGWGTLLQEVAGAIAGDVTLQRFLESPRIPASNKVAMLSRALGDRAPQLFLKFLQALVRNRRQTLIPEIATEYASLLDASNGIVHARVTVARETADDERTVIAEKLSKAVGKTVVPHLTVDPSILGGIVVRMGDTVMDGSVVRKLQTLRSKMGR